ncbi:L,D-transpeptidase [Hyphomicrobium sulfonivorans]|uniref:L,D-transpeptidase n=1 Tax=Hyphomicrobium sulfonivorans TaxID=121290 RepID=UPI0018E17ABD|nr:L,D-transpeptidase [Hyphomicrobium sulfonivorans]MBI1649758.1 L,D-transpeptidase [Hyphomicrobium sulfonivorans]NSL71674.1 hypothetical protein [Hyphomicrobium sulfonivorans]
MLWRVALATIAVVAFGDFAPASAQLYGWQPHGQTPFWEQKPRQRKQQQNRNARGAYGDYGYEWGYGDDYRRSPIVRSGGARPNITPRPPAKVAFVSEYEPNSIVIDSDKRMLYYVLSSNEAYQYPISVGRDGFTWLGTETVSRMQAWPDWHPPKEMIKRDPRLPDKMTGGLRNPLGAKALYLGDTLYRIHGTNDPKSIGRAASSGCFRMMNEHVMHLASITEIGSKVTVVKRLPKETFIATAKPTHDAKPSQSATPQRETTRSEEALQEDAAVAPEREPESDADVFAADAAERDAVADDDDARDDDDRADADDWNDDDTRYSSRGYDDRYERNWRYDRYGRM